MAIIGVQFAIERSAAGVRAAAATVFQIINLSCGECKLRHIIIPALAANDVRRLPVALMDINTRAASQL